jgi:hypothetical protein
MTEELEEIQTREMQIANVREDDGIHTRAEASDMETEVRCRVQDFAETSNRGGGWYIEVYLVEQV